MLIFIFYISFLFYLFHFITYIFINSIIISLHSHCVPLKPVSCLLSFWFLEYIIFLFLFYLIFSDDFNFCL